MRGSFTGFAGWEWDMKSAFRLLVLTLLVGGWGLAALSLHAVRTNDFIPLTLVPKDRMGVDDTYVDVRSWTIADVPAHRALVERLIRTGHADVLRHVTEDDHVLDIESQLADALQRAPSPRIAKTKAGRSQAEQAQAGAWPSLNLKWD
jgi:hypothetical protein